MADGLENQGDAMVELMESNSGVPVAEEGEQKEENTELEKYWAAVRENANDFTGWTYLLQYVEQENKLESAREAYDAFFELYPYCYGYWKKYADMEKRHGNLEKAIQVFEKGVQAIPLSIELWLHYVNFYVTEYGKAEQGEADIRKLYEKAIEAAGKDFRSDKLWDSYLAWEKDKVRLTKLYHRILSVPTQMYSHHFDNFKLHVTKNEPRDIIPLEDFLQLRKDIVDSEKVADEEEDASTAPPGEEVPPGLESEGPVIDEAELTKLRDKIIQMAEQIYTKTEEEVSKRWNFEDAIKRPYFHVKPLEKQQLKNWKEYLDFEIQEGSHDRIVLLFERSLIACALYEEFWMKYAKYLEDHQDSTEAVRSVYSRACKIHLPKKPYIHVAWAAFEERQKNHASAYEILSALEKSVPDLVMVAMRRISLERRMGNYEDVENLFQDYIENATEPSVSSFYSIKYSRFLLKVVKRHEKSKEVLLKAIEKDKENFKLYLQLLDHYYQSLPVEEEEAVKVFSMILDEESFPLETKVKMSQRKLEFLEDFGVDVGRLKNAYDDHQKLLKELNSEKKKRSADSSDKSMDEPPEKRAKESTATQNGSGDMSHAQQDPNASYYNWAAYQQTGYYPQQAWGNYGSHYYQS